MARTSQKPAAAPLILASTSRYRSELLARLRVPFTIEAPQVDESPWPLEAPRDRAVRLAARKAAAVAARHPEATVIGSDQVCECSGVVLGKPLTLDENRLMLRRLSAQTAIFHTAVSLRMSDGSTRQHVDRTSCHFRRLDHEAIDTHLSLEPALDCAGGFKIEGRGIALCERIESDDPTALIGLPLLWLASALGLP